ncbi:MAG: hypothetical protein ACRDIL_18695 [Candidatus Limnocylindrales bacterium]
MAEADAHRRHDRITIAATVDAGMTAPSWLAACLACTILRTDLLAIRSSISTAARPTRPRDYRLTMGDAARLRHRTWRRLVGVIGSPRDAITRPLAASLTALGIASLVIGVVPAAGTGMLGVAGAPASDQPASHQVEQRAPMSIPTEIDSVTTVAGQGTGSTTVSPDPGPDPAIPLSLLLLTGGATLFGVRRLASRLGPVR